MHPAILRQLAADHIKKMHAQADDQRQARQARRRAPSSGLRLDTAGGVLHLEVKNSARTGASTPGFTSCV